MKRILLSLFILVTVFLGFLYLSVSGDRTESPICDLVNLDSISSIDFHQFDSVEVAASQFYEADLIKTWIQGENYRTSWSTPVSLPILWLDTFSGGLTILEEGGGQQTQSLDLKDSLGIVYSLRSINKNPDPVIPDVLSELGLENIVNDGISAQHPFGALVAGSLAEAAGIIHTNPRPYFVPQQKSLGAFNDKYGNGIYWLEYESEGLVNWTHLDSIVEIVDTDDLQEMKMKIGHGVTIDTISFIKARLFDFLIGDWDRHAKQWGWALQQVGDRYRAVPVPADRDNAFFNIDGIVPTIISMPIFNPELRSFEREIDHLPGMLEDVDIYFLKDMPISLFVRASGELQSSLTDSVIITQIKNAWPKEMYDIEGNNFISIITARKNDLLQYAEAFYHYLEKQPYLDKPLAGSEDIQIPTELMRCFECYSVQ